MDTNGYDTTGLSSSLLAVGLLIPSITVVYFASGTQKTKTACKCNQCLGMKKKYRFNKYRWLLYGLVLLLAVPVYNILCNQYGKNTDNNPYTLLNVSQNATHKEIEAAYRKTVRKAKFTKMDRTAQKKLVQRILKAKDLLLDEKARERWDAFGDAPVVNNHTIAIPSWVMSKYNPIILIFLYVLVLGVLLPKCVSYMWMYSFEYSSSGILYRSTESLYSALKHISVEDVIGLLALLSKYTVEISQYSEKTPKKNIDKLRETIKDKYGFTLPLDTNVFILCVSMLLLRDPEVLSLIDAQDIECLQNSLVLSSNAIRKLASAFKSSSLYGIAMDLERSVVQSVPDPIYYQMQAGLPFRDVFIAQYQNKKIDENTAVDRKMFKINITGIDVYNMFDGLVKDGMYVTGSVDTIVKIHIDRDGLNSYTRPTIVKNESKASDSGDLDDLEQNYEDQYPSSLEKHPIKVQGTSFEAVHAPMYFDDLPYTWECILEVNNEVVLASYSFTPCQKGTDVFFKVPALASFISTRRAEIEVKLICGKYFNRDTAKKISVLIK
ncbi:translocation protein SEC63 [Nematocida ausubeli]|nr:translocation protein SEC63 [Nematocida ausubeli]